MSDPYKEFVEAQVASITRSLTKVMFGDFSVNARTQDPDETFGYLCTMINVAINTARNAQGELVRANDALFEAQEQERRRVARELHDGVNQLLSVAKMKVESAQTGPTPEEDLAGAARILAEAIADIRRISSDLRPMALDDLGLATAVGAVCQLATEAQGIEVHFHSEGDLQDVPKVIESNLFRIAQEAVQNVIQHARATRANVSLVGRAESVELTIEDNGRGFDVTLAQSISLGAGAGLFNMQHRTRHVRGEFQVKSSRDTGTRIRVTVPIPQVPTAL